MKAFSVKTGRRNEMIDITDPIAKCVSQSNVQDGVVIAYVPHTTAGVTINENADPSVVHDILMTLEELVPENRSGYRHMEGNSDAHVKASLVGSSVTVILQDGKLQLGTWQSVYFCEFDGPRSREVMVQVLKAQ